MEIWIDSIIANPSTMTKLYLQLMENSEGRATEVRYFMEPNYSLWLTDTNAKKAASILFAYFKSLHNDRGNALTGSSLLPNIFLLLRYHSCLRNKDV